jgi:hypothetical protein
MGCVGLILVAMSEYICFGEEFGESFDPFFGAEEVGWYYVVFIAV